MIYSVGKSAIALKLIEMFRIRKETDLDQPDICHPDVEYIAFDHIQIEKGTI
jgi:hypothetical protein